MQNSNDGVKCFPKTESIRIIISIFCFTLGRSGGEVRDQWQRQHRTARSLRWWWAPLSVPASQHKSDPPVRANTLFEWCIEEWPALDGLASHQCVFLMALDIRMGARGACDKTLHAVCFGYSNHSPGFHMPASVSDSPPPTTTTAIAATAVAAPPKHRQKRHSVVGRA